MILESDETGSITVNVASIQHNGITGALCQAIALKLMHDDTFKAELMELSTMNDAVTH